MEYHKYSLSKKGKATCPECGRKTFVLYINNNTGKAIHPTVGRCDRSDNCGYHYAPKQYFTNNHIPFDDKGGVKEFTPPPKSTPKPQPSFIDTEILKRSLSGYEQNQFAQWLAGIVGDEQASKAIGRYFVGTSKNGGACFWQVDLYGKVRAGKIIVYGKDGHRRKDIIPPVSWVHNVLKLPDFVLSQCLFGEHLLRDTTKKVAIVESEKSALIASCYLPDMTWLACGGCEGLNAGKCAVLKGRSVILYPDCGKYDKWSTKAGEMSRICSVSVSSLIENNATQQERQAGFDIADYLVQFSPSDFSNPEQAETPYQEQGGQSVAYVSDDGKLYIATPPDGHTTYTVYPNIEAYNKRSELPSFVPFQSLETTGMKQIFINLNTLTI